MPQSATDKLTLDTSAEEDKPIAELLSRLEPGDKVKFEGEATVDEFLNNVAILSIESISVNGGDPEPEVEAESEGEAVSVKLFKKKKADGEEQEPAPQE